MTKTDDFISTLVVTNKTHSFFTDWEKVRSNREKYKDELALLGVMTGALDPASELRRLLKTYPRLNQLIPLLTAVRIKSSDKTLFVLEEETNNVSQYYFGENGITNETVEKTISFTRQSGLLMELVTIKNHGDYYFGVEVGLDTNGRKNRSGTAMEELVEPYVRALVEKYDGKYITQTNFENAAEIFGVEVPPNQRNKRGDFMLLVKGKPYNIETNFFDGGGSKQEVINSYISRAEDLRKAGWGFAVVSDGTGWRGNRAQVDHAYATIKNLYNLSMCEDGRIKEMLG